MSDELLNALRPLIELVIEAGRPGAVHVREQLPPDKQKCSYPVLWNAFKKLASR
jgi:hypothetical protein